MRDEYCSGEDDVLIAAAAGTRGLESRLIEMVMKNGEKIERSDSGRGGYTTFRFPGTWISSN